jgi:hypothetical protein
MQVLCNVASPEDHIDSFQLYRLLLQALDGLKQNPRTI